MSLEIYYPADIRNALLAAEQAAAATADASKCRDDVFAAGFLSGYRAALTTLALAFGLGPSSASTSSSGTGTLEPEGPRSFTLQKPGLFQISPRQR